MKRKLSIILMLVLCAALVLALSVVALADDEVAIGGKFDIYSTCYPYGEEAHTIVIETEKPLNPASVAASDFMVRYVAPGCFGTSTVNRNVSSVSVDGNKVTLNLVMTGSGTNNPITMENSVVSITGEVADTSGTVYTTSNFVPGKQINPELDQMLEFQTSKVKYRLYIPEKTDKAAPIYIWLHGIGEFGSFGDNNRSQVSCSNLVDWLKPDVQGIFDNSLYVMAIQSPESPHVPADLKAAIDEVVARYNIDKNRIYIAGCSMGGQGTNDMISAYPDFFAAAIPDCAANTISAENAAKLVDLPIIFVHALNDGTVNPINTITSYNNLKAAGSNKVWINFFNNNGNNPVTNSGYDGHWSWIWIHSNYTTRESRFVNGAGTFTRDNTSMDYVSTPLSQIGKGYANIAEWLADQSKAGGDEPIVPDEPQVLTGEFNYYSACYNYGEEVNSVVIKTAKALDPATVEASDFSVYVGRNRNISSIAVDGDTVTINLQMRGSATNTAIAPSNARVTLQGEVKDTDGVTYTSSDLTAIAQINPELDAMIEGRTEYVQYRLYIPEASKTTTKAAPEDAPLYIWLHGAGEFGDNNRTQVSCADLVKWTRPAVQEIFDNNLYVMAIQSKSSPHNPAYLMEAILEVCENYNIDMDRIYIAGCSMGGRGTNDMIRTYPDFFAAAVPDCPASVLSAEDAAKLVDLPIIYLHAANDTTVRLSNSIQSWQRLKDAGSEKAYCNFFTMPPISQFSSNNSRLMGHFSWAWMHNNYTTTEEEFIKGANVYSYQNVDYPYVSTPLSEIDDGYASIAHWMAAQTRAVEVEPDVPLVIEGEFNYYSACYNFGEEVYAVVIKTAVPLDPATVEASDFSVYVGRNRNISSVEVDGDTVTLNLQMRGSATNQPIPPANARVTFNGEVAGVDGKVYSEGAFTAVAQINEDIEKFTEGATDNLKYRLFVPERNGAPAKNAPLYVWLHGGGEFGTDNRIQIACADLPLWTHKDVQDIFGGSLYILAPQTPVSPHKPADIMEAILEVCDEYDIDMSRIYVSGCSMGGMGTNDMIRTYPEFFAAAVPDCPANIISPEDAAKLVDLPIIYLQAENDTTLRLSQSIQSYDNLKAAGSENVWCNFFSVNPISQFSSNNRRLMGHFSWAWIHGNYTTTEPEFINGEGVFTYNNVDYPYVSTPLSEIGPGYPTIAHWLAAQTNVNVGIRVDTVEVNAFAADTVEIPVVYTDDQDITTVRVTIDADLPIADVVSDNDIAFNPETNEVIVYAPLGGTFDKNLFTLIFDVDESLPDGKYPVNLIVDEVTDSVPAPIPVKVFAGAVVINNVYPKGDISKDGDVTNADLILLARYLVHLVEFDEKQIAAADINDDGIINNSDLVLLARMVVE